ncbi:MAG: DUF4263 domain-containing protein [Verrucomicrobiaceae bacterium]|nr:MAG: DUF4263 domain-containing protein [Verrucomicrobiaceae bacterium]
MAKTAVEFAVQGTKLHLVYRPDVRSPESLRESLASGSPVIIKGTYHLTQANLVKRKSKRDLDDWDVGSDEMRFVIATARRGYLVFDPKIFDVGVPVLIALDAKPTWKWFTAEERTSVLRVLAELKPSRIVIGGDAPDAIPVSKYEGLIAQFPSPHERRLYVQSRLAGVFRELTDAQVDAVAKLDKYVQKRVKTEPKDLAAPFRALEIKKYEFLYAQLQAMLKDDAGIPERQWQTQILDIVRLLNPKYIAAITSVTIKDSLTGGHRQLDIMLVDVNGHVDVIEIKKPFKARIVTTTKYRDNHVPHRELVGTAMQLEKYLFHLSRWGETGEKKLTEQYSSRLPQDMRIRIVNPCGIIIMGRDNDLDDDQQKADFEVYRRQSKNIVDVITYDDLLRRLERVLDQLRADR